MGFLDRGDPLESLGDLTTSDDGITIAGPRRFRKAIKRWVRMMRLDVLVLALVGGVQEIIFRHHRPFVTRVFPVTYDDGRVVFPEFSYPKRKELFPTFQTALVSVLIPFAVISLMQVWVRSFWDWNNAVLGLCYSLLGASAFQLMLKMFIGGLRPDFYAVCQPTAESIQHARGNGWATGYQEMVFDRRVCTGDPHAIDDALASFPSGHATAALAGFLYLALYINGKVKAFSDKRTAFWKVVLIMTPICIAVLLSAAKTVDMRHNWYDVFAGAVIGIVFALVSYRSMFAAIWDYRMNDLALVERTDELDEMSEAEVDGTKEMENGTRSPTAA